MAVLYTMGAWPGDLSDAEVDPLKIGCPALLLKHGPREFERFSSLSDLQKRELGYYKQILHRALQSK
jgi:hypothetical protein